MYYTIRLCCAEEKTQSVLFVECFLKVGEILATEFIVITWYSYVNIQQGGRRTTDSPPTQTTSCVVSSGQISCWVKSQSCFRQHDNTIFTNVMSKLEIFIISYYLKLYGKLNDYMSTLQQSTQFHSTPLVVGGDDFDFVQPTRSTKIRYPPLCLV